MSDPASSFDASYHAYYTAVYRDDEATRQRLLAFYARVLGPELPHDLSSPILDLGCGSGHALRFLRSRGHTQLHGIVRLDPMVGALIVIRPGSGMSVPVSCFG